MFFPGVIARDREWLWHRGPAARLSQDRHRRAGGVCESREGVSVFRGEPIFGSRDPTVTGTTNVTSLLLSWISNCPETKISEPPKGSQEGPARGLRRGEPALVPRWSGDSGAPARQCLASQLHRPCATTTRLTCSSHAAHAHQRHMWKSEAENATAVVAQLC